MDTKHSVTFKYGSMILHGNRTTLYDGQSDAAGSRQGCFKKAEKKNCRANHTEASEVSEEPSSIQLARITLQDPSLGNCEACSTTIRQKEN